MPPAAGLDPYNKDTALDCATEIVSFTSCFHGRTMGSLALTYKDQYRTPFQPVMPGNVMVPYQDLEAAKAVIQKVGVGKEARGRGSGDGGGGWGARRVWLGKGAEEVWPRGWGG